MSLFKFANFIATELEEGISAGATEMIVPVGATELLPTLGVDEEIRLTLWDGQNDPEIVGVTDNPQTGVLQIERGKEDTTARSWGTGTQVKCVLTAEIINTALEAFFDINTVLDANFLKLAGGTLTGALQLPATTPTSGTQAVNKAYADLIGAGRLPTAGGAMSGQINMNNNNIIGLPNPTASSAATRKAYVDSLIAALQGQLTAGTAVYTTAGTDTVYTVASIAGDLDDTDLVDGYAVIIRPHVVNAADATVKIDAMTAKPLELESGEGLPADIVFAGTPYTIVYSTTSDSWLIAGSLNIVDLEARISDLEVNLMAPVGTPLLLPGATVPAGWQQDATVNDRVIRVVSTAGGGTGGSWVISGVTVNATTLVEAHLPFHAHGVGSLFAASHQHNYSRATGNSGRTSGGNSVFHSNTTESTGSSGNLAIGGATAGAGSNVAHGHGLTIDGLWRPAYLDVMRIVKL